MMTPNVTVGGSNVFASGTVLTVNDAPIRILLFGEPSDYFLEIRFVTDESGPVMRNFNEAAGHVVALHNLGMKLEPNSNINPLYVANSAGRKLLLNLAITTVGATPVARSVVYTIIDGGPQ